MEGYYQGVLRMRQHVYVVEDGIITNRLRLLKEDWQNHRVVLSDDNGYKQVVKFVYENNDNRRPLQEMIFWISFRGGLRLYGVRLSDQVVVFATNCCKTKIAR